MGRQYEVVVMGATGFTGSLVAEYLLREYGVNRGLRWAIAGRSQKKLEAVKDGLADVVGSDKGAADDIPVLIADSGDESSLNALCAATEVVVSTVGPFVAYGSLLVKCCIANGTSYCDSTGETSWIRRMLDDHQAEAVANKVRLVPSCGYDSMPSDLGAFALVQAIKADGLEPGLVTHYIGPLEGGASGGTIHTVLNMFSSEDKKLLLKVYTDPQALATGLDSDKQLCSARGADQRWAHWVPAHGVYSAPFFMGPGNERLVRRSAALEAYGGSFAYAELFAFQSAFKAFCVAMAMTLSFGLLALPPVRWLAAKVVPAPGEGPSRAAMDNGFARSTLVATAANDRSKHFTCEVAITKGDVGYKSTSFMLGEAAVALARSRKDEGAYGFLTPASCPGLQSTLMDALVKTGISFSVHKHDTAEAARKVIKTYDSKL